jgi:glutaconate CoA-transferase subunit A
VPDRSLKLKLDLAMPDARLLTLDRLVAEIPDGAKLAVPANYAGVAMAATRALVRRGVKDLHLVCVPTSGLQADILIGTGAVATLETSAVTLGEAGPAPRFGAAVAAGAIRLLDATCPVIHAGLQAAQKGIPFLPLRGIIGSDLPRHRTDWQVIDNPFAEGKDPILLVPAIRPDIALFHAPRADRHGNVWVGRRRELIAMAQASATTLVTVERIEEGSLLDDEVTAAGVLPALYVGAIAEAPRGAWPLALWGAYGEDEAHLARYAGLAATADGFRRYVAEHVLERVAAE